ncbi:MAG: aminotransferase class I/II-fold pyridoxal phosphate-dependent enzyme [Opitutaceae bacterium]|nr:aminotransferase class I/II-fold pyridoxal phosphate-dependent enzyme [Opitutaceae bacterium]
MPDRKSRVYLSSPHMGGDELRLVTEAFASNWIAPLGPSVDAFEAEFAARVGTAHAAALSSGTAALHLAMRWLRLQPGDEVICSTFTFSATVNPIVYEGARPVFVDCERESWNMSPELLAEAIADRVKRGRRPKAVVLVHIYGQSADLDPIVALCARYGIPLIEDAAEALGATYRGRVPGSSGLCGIHSFNGNKIITTSGGGMLVSNDGALIEKARFWATQARDAAPHYQHSEIGFNYRLSNVLAAIGRGQLRVLDDRVAARRAHCAAYQAALAGLPGLEFMPEAAWGRSTRWLTCVLIDPEKFGADREKVRLALEAENIEARPVWKPMHLQPVFAGSECYGGAVAEDLFARGLCLPSGSNLTAEDRGRVIAAVQAAARRR